MQKFKYSAFLDFKIYRFKENTYFHFLRKTRQNAKNANFTPQVVVSGGLLPPIQPIYHHDSQNIGH